MQKNKLAHIVKGSHRFGVTLHTCLLRNKKKPENSNHRLIIFVTKLIHTSIIECKKIVKYQVFTI